MAKNRVMRKLEYYQRLALSGKAQPTPTDWKPDKKEITRVLQIHNRGSDSMHGVTYNFALNSIGKTKEPCYAVSIFPTRTKLVTGYRLTQKDIASYVSTNGDLLGQRSVALGTWYDKDSNKTYLDCVVTVTNKDLPVITAMAKGIGILARQLAVFNLQSMEELALPKNLQTDKAMAIDRSKTAKHILPITDVEAWAKYPSRFDIRGLDTPLRRKPTVGKKGKIKPRVTKGITEETESVSPLTSSKMPPEVAAAIGSLSAKVVDGKPKIKVRRL